jgi:hypothetical protein
VPRSAPVVMTQIVTAPDSRPVASFSLLAVEAQPLGFAGRHSRGCDTAGIQSMPDIRKSGA